MKRKNIEANQTNSEEQITKQVNLGKGTGAAVKQTPSDLANIIKNCLANKDYKTLVKHCYQQPDIYKEYKKLKFKNTVYTVEDPLMIANGDDSDNDYIGKLKKIIRIDQSQQVHTLIQMQWYYKKSDIPDKYESYKSCFSENELFLTEHLDYALVDCINGQCEILDYETYDQLPSIPNNTFYSRANYDAQKKKFNPPIEKWQKGCICNKPLNPDFLYIQCDKCSLWIHTDCVGIAQEEVDKIENYECQQCQKK